VAPFDRWVAGDEKAISDSAKHGFVLFNTTGNCTACHSGWTFTDDSFHDIGLPATTDLGRAEIVAGVPELERAFKTPGLRNIAQRAPYMHDGSVATLEDVVRHYMGGIVQRPSLSPEIKPIALTDQDVTDMVAFLQTLTSEDRPMTLPVLP
jgi:cytochrome c peroxidase